MGAPPSRSNALTIVALALGALACGPGPAAPRAGDAPTMDRDSTSSTSAVPESPPREETRRRASDLTSIETGQATQIYYQFVDRSGAVRFVSRLDAVPPEWRDRVGFVEMSTPPPVRPSDAQRIRQLRDEDIARRVAERQASSYARGQASSATPYERADVSVILYSADWCGACRAAKSYMDANGIEYDERDVDDPQWHDEMVAKAGRGGIPVFDVEGEILRGFAPRRLEALIDDAAS